MNNQVSFLMSVDAVFDMKGLDEGLKKMFDMNEVDQDQQKTSIDNFSNLPVLNSRTITPRSKPRPPPIKIPEITINVESKKPISPSAKEVVSKKPISPSAKEVKNCCCVIS